MNPQVARAPAATRRHLLLGVVLVPLLGLAARAVVALDDPPAAPAHKSSLLKSILEPWFASKDGKDPHQDPEYRQAMREQWRLSVEAKYFQLVWKLELSPALTIQLYDLLVDHLFESLDNPTYYVSTPEYQALKRKQDGELATLIGEHGLAQLQQYDETFAYRNDVNRLQRHFARGTEVLRDDQVDAMIAIMRDAARKMERTQSTGADFALRRQRDASILKASVTVLTPAQHAALDASIRREQVHWELLEIAREIVPVGKTAVARDPHAVTGYFLVGTNDGRLLQDPEYRRTWLEEKRLEVESTYIDVPVLLKLSPELTDRFFSLMVNQQLRRTEMPTNSVSGYEGRLRQEDGELTTLLGESNYASFLGFQDSYAQRYQVKDLQIAIGAGTDALREDQVEKLLSILLDAEEEMRRAGPAANFIFKTKAMRKRQLELGRQRDARIRESAAAILTPRQFAALEAWIRWDLAL